MWTFIAGVAVGIVVTIALALIWMGSRKFW